MNGPMVEVSRIPQSRLITISQYTSNGHSRIIPIDYSLWTSFPGAHAGIILNGCFFFFFTFSNEKYCNVKLTHFTSEETGVQRVKFKAPLLCENWWNHDSLLLT